MEFFNPTFIGLIIATFVISYIVATINAGTPTLGSWDSDIREGTAFSIVVAVAFITFVNSLTVFTYTTPEEKREAALLRAEVQARTEAVKELTMKQGCAK